MNITKYIEEILVDRFAQFGFKYEKSDFNWTFIREIGGVKEYIEIEKSEWYKNAIRCEYRKGTSSRNTIAFLRDRIEQVHVYSDETTLREELESIVEVTEKFAMDWFETIKVGVKSSPDNFLGSEWNITIQSFISENNIDLNNPQSILTLDNLLKKEISREDIYSVSYCFGEITRHHLGGEWDVHSEDGPFIKNIAGSKEMTLKPYNLVMKTMVAPNELSLMYFFEIFKNAANEMN
ncbi:hypothetical protein [Paenibacillus sp. PDC88]|uniref:hypothetical protein n=1 Tax=Paenibacillus sp. PDC88 TaxID=1884375 RepID=UPI00089B0FA6|nr:hypothetical protein [Paenibacillus sp. PDC88]SDX68182.1 hypothetical protein SAMN05518848_111118 [Paenibacillus sp. PDC88]